MNICKLFKQGKINAQTVPTTLGGGQCGYLSLFIKTVSYNAIPNSAPFVHPTDPGLFATSPQIGPVTQAGSSLPLNASDVATKKITNYELLREYDEAQAI